jgi:RsiW-degrading membrane proteinase PrsW (M82 family)
MNRQDDSSDGTADQPGIGRSGADGPDVDEAPERRVRAGEILWPFQFLRDFGRDENLRLVLASFLGLFPLLVVTVISISPLLTGVGYWLLAFYFAVVWAIFFRFLIPRARPRWYESLGFFFGVGVFSMLFLQILYHWFGLGYFLSWMGSDDPVRALLGNWLGAGLPEELVKGLPVLYYVHRNPGTLNFSTIVFLGVLAGLGFGIYEGVNYQKDRNFDLADNPGEYYLLNVLRLTALPFLHSMWTGIAAFFIGLSTYCRRRWWVLILAFLLPSVLHGLFNYFGRTYAHFGMAIMSVIFFNIYLAHMARFERSPAGG